MPLHLNPNSEFNNCNLLRSVGILSFVISIPLILYSSESGIAKASAIASTCTASGALFTNAATTANKERKGFSEALDTVLQGLEKGEISIESVSKELSPYLSLNIKEKLLSLSSSVRGYLNRVRVCQELSQYIEDERSHPILFDLADQAAEYVFEESSKDQPLFAKDIYQYLRNWLKNSIEHEAALPDKFPPLFTERAIDETEPYIKAFSFLRDERTDSFLNSKYPFTFSKDIHKKILDEHLSGLIEKFREDDV